MSYIDGVRSGIDAGIIRLSDETIPFDEYGVVSGNMREMMLGMLCWGNTTPLHPLAEHALRRLNEHRNSGTPECLVLGPGAGTALPRMKEIVPDAAIDTVSLSPFSPYHLPDRPYMEIVERMIDARERLSEPLREMIDEHTTHYSNLDMTAMPLEAIERYQEETGETLLQQIDDVVRSEFVGRYGPGSIPPDRVYDFIYEDRGPLRYYQPKPGCEEPYDPASIEYTLRRLKPSGVLLFTAGAGYADKINAINGVIKKSERMFLRDYKYLEPVLVFDEASPVHADAARILPGTMTSLYVDHLTEKMTGAIAPRG